MHYLLLIYFVVAFGMFLIPRKYSKKDPFVLALVQTGIFLFFLFNLPEVAAGKNIHTLIPWLPDIGLDIELRLDGLSMAFALLVSGIGALIFLFSKVYMEHEEYTRRFYFYLFIFSAAMLGMVLSYNLILLFIFWELTSFFSYLLISFYNEKESARDAAFQSLYVTVFGGLFLLAGIILIGSIVDSYSLGAWIEHSERIKSSPLYLPGLLLILVGVFSKSAQFPFHFWLPGAMQAPTPVSAYLHSATMVKAGIFLIARISPVMGGTPEWTHIIPLFGAITMLLGAYFAITQTDLKAILAYTTISALGILVLLIGMDTSLSFKAAIVFLYVHALYKATLFMIAGIISEKTGTRDINKLGGLFRYMPITGIIAGLALLSMAGLPPMLGFLGKELIYEAKVQAPGIASIILFLGVASNILMVAVSLYLGYRVFLGKGRQYSEHVNDNGMFWIIGPGILALMSLLLGLMPNLLGNLIIQPALSLVRPEDIAIKLKHWHGFNQVFFLSLFTVLSGFTLFMTIIKRKKLLLQWTAFNQRFFKIRLTNVFTETMDKFVAISKRNTKFIQHGYHRYYIMSVIIFASILLWFQVYVTQDWHFATIFSVKPFFISGLIMVIFLSTIFTLITNSRISAIIGLGVTGYGIALIYLYYSAIDLAITQILVETLTMVIFLIILQRLPRFARLSSRNAKLRDLLISAVFGGVMTVLALKAIHIDFNHPISDYFIENSYVKAFGKNIVNVILVDFRAMDTWGEVTVLTIAALGVYVLINKKTNLS